MKRKWKIKGPRPPRAKPRYRRVNGHEQFKRPDDAHPLAPRVETPRVIIPPGFKPPTATRAIRLPLPEQVRQITIAFWTILRDESRVAKLLGMGKSDVKRIVRRYLRSGSEDQVAVNAILREALHDSILGLLFEATRFLSTYKETRQISPANYAKTIKIIAASAKDYLAMPAQGKGRAAPKVALQVNVESGGKASAAQLPDPQQQGDGGYPIDRWAYLRKLQNEPEIIQEITDKEAGSPRKKTRRTTPKGRKGGI